MTCCLQTYALQRLVRGLGSGRQGARQGFAVALTALLQQVPAVPTTVVLQRLQQDLQTNNSMKVCVLTGAAAAVITGGTEVDSVSGSLTACKRQPYQVACLERLSGKLQACALLEPVCC